MRFKYSFLSQSVQSGLLLLLGITVAFPANGQKKSTPVRPSSAPPLAPSAASLEFFEKRVRPILVENCYQCHAKVNGMAQGGMQLDSREGLLKGGKRGAAVVAGSAEKSLLIHAIRYTDASLQMPPKGKLSADDVAALTKWISEGAGWSSAGAGKAPAVAAFDIQTRKKHWAWQPLQNAVIPVVKNTAWARNPIDRFILAKLEAGKLKPAPAADKRTLLRRVTFDLIGLPPTPQESDAFLADTSPNAYEKVVARLLASPHYGERWGRHWLDLVRYAETDGHEFDFDKPNAWQYRDYVIRALNADVPYNQFVTEQVAGDLLPHPRLHPTEGYNEALIGTGFFWFGEGKHSPVDLQVDEAERIDNQIDVFSKTFLGLSVGCARCHNHKFDAISTKDYYALSGYLKSSRFQLAPIETPERQESKLADLKTVQEQLQPLLLGAAIATERKGLERFEAELTALASPPHPVTASLHSGTSLASPLSNYLHGPAVREASNPFYPLYKFLFEQLAEKPETFRTRAQALATELKRQREQGTAATAKAVVFEDFHTGDYRNWTVSGSAFGKSPERVGLTVRYSSTTPQSIVLMGPGVANSGGVGGRLQGELRSKTFTIAKNRILYHLAGTGVTVNLVIDGFQRIRYPIYGGLTFVVNNPQPVWYAMEVSKWIGHKAYIEVLDAGDGCAMMDKILFTDGPNPPPVQDARIIALLEDPNIGSPAALIPAYRKLFTAALQELQEGRTGSADSVALLDWMLANTALFGEPNPATYADLEPLLKKRLVAEQALSEPHRIMAITDGSPEDDVVHIRGNYKTPGDLVPRRFFEALDGPRQPAPAVGSGRLELAQRLTAANNPLLPRVMVNRLWQHHFGEGIVKTPDDFGVMGERPTHPELLDWLAREFVRQGWSLKKMHRLMVLSSTYRMASRSDAKSDETDPQNRLLHKANIRRLEAECIRDAALAVSGRLNPQLFGPSVMPYLTEFMAGRGRPGQSGPLDGDGRRSIYIGVRRNFLTPLFLAFDYPVPFTSIGRRTVSNVPAQALALMNNPLFQQQAEVWAKKTLAVPNLTPQQRINTLYIEAFGRPVTSGETEDALAFLAEQDKGYGTAGDLRSWTDLCHVLFNVKEFIFLE